MKVEFNNKDKEILNSIGDNLTYKEISEVFKVSIKYIHCLVMANYYKEDQNN